MAKTVSKKGRAAFAIILVTALAAIAVCAAGRLELYERTTWDPDSGEARLNNFHVLGRWLSKSGYPVRFFPRWAGIKTLSPREGGLFLMASLLDWEKDGETLLPWVRAGGALIISVDSAWYWRLSESPQVAANLAALEDFLKNLGLPLDVHRLEDETGVEEEGPEASAETAVEVRAGEPTTEADVPEYDRTIRLEAAEEAGQGELVLRDERGVIRLVRRNLGKGHVTVTGSCYFMHNRNLGIDANARLSWELTGASLSPERPGMLFVRGRRTAGGLFEALLERGNLLPPLVSAAVLVVIGFWTAIPGFGVRREEEAAGRTTSGRFAAEARFLRRYGACAVYLEAYLRELRRRSGGREPGREIREVEAALAPGKRISRRNMARYLKTVMSALERI
jgi:hypothetical protein